MTLILTTSMLTTVLSYAFTKSIRKYSYLLYVLAGIIALLASEDANTLSMGYVPFGLFLVVMYTGVLNKSVLKKRLLMVRKELSIIACILLASHVFPYLEYYLDELGLFQAQFSFYIGVFAAIVLIPLFLTSFQQVRKRMSYKSWKSIHRLSYVFYFLLSIHLISIQNDRQFMYLILFGVYWVMKLYEFIQRKPTTST